MKKNLPRAKNKNLIMQEIKDDLLLYNLETQKAFCLNKTLATVFRACDGKTSFAELMSEHNFTEDLIFFSLDELKKEKLLENDDSFQSPLNGLSRREAVKRVGFATMIALPVISSLVAPTAIHAASCLGSGGTFDAAGGPYANVNDCVTALQQQADTRCCSGSLNPLNGFIYGSNPYVCRGFCS